MDKDIRKIPLPDSKKDYFVDKYGNIYTYDKKGNLFEMKKNFDGVGYYNLMYLKKTDDGSKKYGNLGIHRAVAMVFIPNPLNKETVNHKDGNKINNNVDNLEWATKSENAQHSWDNKLSHSGVNLKLTEEDARRIIDLYYIQGFRECEIMNIFNKYSQRIINSMIIGKTKVYRFLFDDMGIEPIKPKKFNKNNDEFIMNILRDYFINNIRSPKLLSEKYNVSYKVIENYVYGARRVDLYNKIKEEI